MILVKAQNTTTLFVDNNKAIYIRHKGIGTKEAEDKKDFSKEPDLELNSVIFTGHWKLKST